MAKDKNGTDKPSKTSHTRAIQGGHGGKEPRQSTSSLRNHQRGLVEPKVRKNPFGSKLSKIRREDGTR
jgi:hypothetical protein